VSQRGQETWCKCANKCRTGFPERSVMGLGRVKTPSFNLRVEIPSRFRKFENQKCLRPLLGEDDRENNSAHFWRVHVFTQPGSFAYARTCVHRTPRSLTAGRQDCRGFALPRHRCRSRYGPGCSRLRAVDRMRAPASCAKPPIPSSEPALREVERLQGRAQRE
jgi:hypothetical protein